MKRPHFLRIAELWTAYILGELESAQQNRRPINREFITTARAHATLHRHLHHLTA